jgi:hypothetical protein
LGGVSNALISESLSVGDGMQASRRERRGSTSKHQAFRK